ncbi:bifunctional riboflavin kinase/FAD synthetase [Corynebacterium freiburgense]|uniref:bifunctional riboflavin kinase/FAD synthetase n=1 Tax=Corynebacterium freiburgense TaxID=556548 RepID=UPI00040565DD|nr:bifunctional riboflavin kinase/FAD synthetase [Corynebacterium freiburgense]WJZ02950.1 Riboflavin biosynthesis protein RibF [Corynebacterium freiburgense]
MDIWHGLEEVPADLGRSVVTIGVFDGVHRGHRTLITQARAMADALGAPCVVMTFDPHPLAVLCPDRMPPMLGNLADRADLAEDLGVDHMLAIRFTPELASQSPEEFFTGVLQNQLHAAAVVVGDNFTFGHRASGNTETLRELGKRYGVAVEVLPLVAEDGTTLSSTVIRGLLNDGDIRRANWALGRNYSVAGHICRGAGRGGRELGYPTANLYFPDSVALPADGVYCGWFTILDDAPVDGDMRPHQRYMTAVSVGTNPTFGDERRSVEAFVLDQEADLYDRFCAVEFVERIRGMVKFHSVDELLEAMSKDVQRAREILAAEPTHSIL